VGRRRAQDHDQGADRDGIGRCHDLGLAQVPGAQHHLDPLRLLRDLAAAGTLEGRTDLRGRQPGRRRRVRGAGQQFQGIRGAGILEGPQRGGKAVPQRVPQPLGAPGRCTVTEAEKATCKIAWMCRLLSVPRSSSSYAWRSWRRLPRRRELSVLVKAASGTGRGAYGCRRVAAALNRDGHPCSVGLAAGLMRELGLRACQPRAYKRTTTPVRTR
jgi:HTH-like domain